LGARISNEKLCVVGHEWRESSRIGRCILATDCAD
jgi:hypothetical protein